MRKIMNLNYPSIICNVIFWIGIVTILLALTYMIFNLANADSFINIWKVLMGTGISFSFIGALGNMLIKISKRHSSSIAH